MSKTKTTDASASKPAKTKKVKKTDVALLTVRSVLDLHSGKETREMRADAIARLKAELGVTNPSTLAVYYSWAMREILARPAKQYNFTTQRQPRAAKAPARVTSRSRKAKDAAPTEEQKLNKLVSSTPRPAKAAPAAEAAAPFVPSSGLVASL